MPCPAPTPQQHWLKHAATAYFPSLTYTFKHTTYHMALTLALAPPTPAPPPPMPAHPHATPCCPKPNISPREIHVARSRPQKTPHCQTPVWAQVPSNPAYPRFLFDTSSPDPKLPTHCVSTTPIPQHPPALTWLVPGFKRHHIARSLCGPKVPGKLIPQGITDAVGVCTPCSWGLVLGPKLVAHIYRQPCSLPGFVLPVPV